MGNGGRGGVRSGAKKWYRMGEGWMARGSPPQLPQFPQVARIVCAAQVVQRTPHDRADEQAVLALQGVGSQATVTAGEGAGTCVLEERLVAEADAPSVLGPHQEI